MRLELKLNIPANVCFKSHRKHHVSVSSDLATVVWQCLQLHYENMR